MGVNVPSDHTDDLTVVPTRFFGKELEVYCEK